MRGQRRNRPGTCVCLCVEVFSLMPLSRCVLHACRCLCVCLRINTIVMGEGKSSVLWLTFFSFSFGFVTEDSFLCVCCIKTSLPDNTQVVVILHNVLLHAILSEFLYTNMIVSQMYLIPLRAAVHTLYSLNAILTGNEQLAWKWQANRGDFYLSAISLLWKRWLT